jgi:F0F1-type ATP synthase membrane subunit b/b'
VEIINQLGQLFLAAVPTVIILFLFYFFLRWSFFKPIERVLVERHKRAEGALAEAETSRAATREKQQLYTESVKKARGEIYAAQEALRRRALDERQVAINQARAAAQNALQEAKKQIATEAQAAQAELAGSSATLANEIADAVLAGVSGPVASPTEGAR